MPEVPLAGCRSRQLLDYLKALGVLRVVARQADTEARGRWASGTFVLKSALDREALEAFLLNTYAPAPVVSPWNGGSGFFPKDNKEGFTVIECSDDPRLASFRAAIASARATLERLDLHEKPAGATKLALLRELRATLPDAALEWLDAAVVLLGTDVAYPPLLGSGGNDGRYDFANNYARSVVAALTGRDAARWLRASLWRAPASLPKMSSGHLFRDASPVNAPHGESDALGNPWDLVLGLEGSLLLAAGAARREAAAEDAAPAAPFTVRATAAGYGSAAAGEAGRDELWLPLWSGAATLRELEATAREARAQVGRASARTALGLARSAAELGVARGIDAFERFAVLERAGQSSLAVPAGRIEVRSRPGVSALDTLGGWLERVLRYGRGDAPASQAAAARRLERATFAFAEAGDPRAARVVLETLGEVEAALAAGGGRTSDGRPQPVRDADALPWLRAAADGSVEFAVAAALASLRDPWPTPSLPAVRDLLHGTKVDEHGARSYGGRVRLPRWGSPVARLAALHARRHLDAERAGAPAGRADRPAGWHLPFRHGLVCPPEAARRFALGGAGVDDDRVLALVRGLCLLDFTNVQWELRARIPPAVVPLYDMLALACQGTPTTPLGPRPGWAARLAGSPRQVPPDLVRDALLRLRMAELAPLVEAADLLVAPSDPRRLGAALLLRLPNGERYRLAERLTEPKSTEGEAA